MVVWWSACGIIKGLLLKTKGHPKCWQFAVAPPSQSRNVFVTGSIGMLSSGYASGYSFTCIPICMSETSPKGCKASGLFICVSFLGPPVTAIRCASSGYVCIWFAFILLYPVPCGYVRVPVKTHLEPEIIKHVLICCRICACRRKTVGLTFVTQSGVVRGTHRHENRGSPHAST